MLAGLCRSELGPLSTPFAPIKSTLPRLPRIAVQQQRKQHRRTFPVDQAIEHVRAPAALERAHRGGHVGNVIAPAFEREEERAVVFKRAGARNARGFEREAVRGQQIPVEQLADRKSVV